MQMKINQIWAGLQLILMLGFSACGIPKDPNRVEVEVKYPGTTAWEVQQLTLIPIEQELNALPNLKNSFSVAQEGGGKITLEFLPDSDPQQNLEAVMNRVQAQESQLPESLGNPPLVHKAPNHHMAFSVQPVSWSDYSLPVEELYRLKEIVQQRPHVTKAEVTGVEQPHVELRFRWNLLRSIGLTPWEVAEQIKTDLLITAPLNSSELYLSPGEEVMDKLRTVKLENKAGRVVSLSSIADFYLTTPDASFPSLDIWVANGFKDEIEDPLRKLVNEEIAKSRNYDYDLVRMAATDFRDYIKVEISGKNQEEVDLYAADLRSRLQDRFTVQTVLKLPEKGEVRNIHLVDRVADLPGISRMELGNAINYTYQTQNVGNVQVGTELIPVLMVPENPPPIPSELLEALQPGVIAAAGDVPDLFSWKMEKSEVLLRKNSQPYALLIIEPYSVRGQRKLMRSVRSYLKEDLENEDFTLTIGQLDFDAFGYLKWGEADPFTGSGYAPHPLED